MGQVGDIFQHTEQRIDSRVQGLEMAECRGECG
jgi:hypothetical protein